MKDKIIAYLTIILLLIFGALVIILAGLVKLLKIAIITIIIIKIITYCLGINMINIPYLPFL